MIEFIVPIDENTVPEEFADDMRKRYTERKRGKWIEENTRPRSQMFICSECGGKVWYPQATNPRAKREKKCLYAFCPWCVSRMDKEEAVNGNTD